MENGIGDTNSYHDYQRIEYLHLYIKEVLLAVNRDGCNIQKYTIWSFIDCFEWNFGYTYVKQRFRILKLTIIENQMENRKPDAYCHFDSFGMGLVNVNFSSPHRERSPRLSVTWLQDVMRTRRVQPPFLP